MGEGGPVKSGEFVSTEPARTGRGVAVQVAAVCLFVFATVVSFLNERSGEPREIIISMFFPALVGLVVLGVVRLFGGAKTARGVAATIIAAMLLVLVGECASVTNPVTTGGGAESGAGQGER